MATRLHEHLDLARVPTVQRRCGVVKRGMKGSRHDVGKLTLISVIPVRFGLSLRSARTLLLLENTIVTAAVSSYCRSHSHCSTIRVRSKGPRLEATVIILDKRRDKEETGVTG